MKLPLTLFLFRVREPLAYVLWASDGSTLLEAHCVLITADTATFCYGDQETVEVPLNLFSDNQEEWEQTLLYCVKELEQRGYTEHELLFPTPNTTLMCS